MYEEGEIMTNILEVSNLTKVYKVKDRKPGFFPTMYSLIKPINREVTAIKDVSFNISTGEIVAYIGVNGSGKSTTIKLLTGILVPTIGSVKVFGKPPHQFRKQICNDIGVVFGQRSQLWWDLPVADSFRIISCLYGLDKDTYHRRTNELDRIFDIKSLFDTPVRQLSLGQKMRCEIAVSILHNPKLLFLDEPTIGLDLFMRERFKDLVLSLNNDFGTTIFFTSHNLHEVEIICKRMILLDSGRVIYDGSIGDFKRENSRIKEVDIEMENEISIEDVESIVNSNSGIILKKVDKRIINLYYETDVIQSIAIISLFSNVGQIKEISIESPSLEQVLKNFKQDRAT